jgi:hypothetical protein
MEYRPGGCSDSIALLALDSGRLDDRPPFFGLGFLESAERFRRLLLAGENILPDIGKS